MTRKQSLQYIKNTAGNATRAHFVDDWEPVGSMEWKMLEDEGLATTNEDGFIILTEKGEQRLKELNNG